MVRWFGKCSRLQWISTDNLKNTSEGLDEHIRLNRRHRKYVCNDNFIYFSSLPVSLSASGLAAIEWLTVISMTQFKTLSMKQLCSAGSCKCNQVPRTLLIFYRNSLFVFPQKLLTLLNLVGGTLRPIRKHTNSQVNGVLFLFLLMLHSASRNALVFLLIILSSSAAVHAAVCKLTETKRFAALLLCFSTSAVSACWRFSLEIQPSDHYCAYIIMQLSGNTDKTDAANLNFEFTCLRIFACYLSVTFSVKWFARTARVIRAHCPCMADSLPVYSTCIVTATFFNSFSHSSDRITF